MILARRYERRGLLAIEPRALFESFFVDDLRPPEVTELDGCAIVDVRGPLENHVHYWCDSYEAILTRVQAACSTAARAVVLRFDSPGGDAHGCFEAALAIRAACDAAGKQLLGYVEGECASAAYALASQCQHITIAMSALVGSIGVLSSREDVTAMNAARGLRVALVMSGSRKGDGHPDMPITDAELANTQSLVDSMAATFFDLVAQGRGIKPVAVAQLQARVFHGEAAVQVGLADAVGSLTTVLAFAASPIGGTKVMAGKKMSYEDLREALAAAAEGTDPNAKAAKRALAVMDEAEPAEAEGGEAEETAEGEPAEETAEGEPAETDEEGKPKPAAKAAQRAEGGEDDKTASTATAAYRMALKAQKESAELRAQLKGRDEAAERQQLIASRPDLPTDTVSLLARAPMALVREHIASLPPLKGEAASALKNPRVVAYGKPVTGKPDPAGASRLPEAEKAELDARMGLGENGLHVVSNEYKLTLGAYKPR
jgi:ClpP class serine protease